MADRMLVTAFSSPEIQGTVEHRSLIADILNMAFMRVLFAVFVLSLIALIATLIALKLYVRKQQPLSLTAPQQEDLPQTE